MSRSTGSCIRVRALLALLPLAVPGAALAQPANDDCADATEIVALPFADTVDTTGATTEAGEAASLVCSSPASPEKSVWYRFTAAAPTSLRVRTAGSDFDTRLVAYIGSCAVPTELACNDTDDNHNQPFTLTSQMVVTLEAGQTAFIQVDDQDTVPTGGNLVLNVTESAVFQANFVTRAAGYFSATAAGSSGDFLVVWDGRLEDGVRGRLFDGGGGARGPEFQVSAQDNPYHIDVAAAGGGFVVVWAAAGIRAQRVDEAGALIGGEIEVAGECCPYNPAVAAEADGDFVVVWQRDYQVVYGRQFDSGGLPKGAPFVVSSVDGAYLPAVAAAPGGDFVVVWSTRYLDGDGFGVFGRRFDAGAAPLGARFQVNTFTLGHQGDTGAGVAMVGAGNFVVVWESYDGGYHPNTPYTDFTQSSVFGQRFGATGAPVGGEFQINTSTAPRYGYGTYGDDQNYWPAVSADAAGNFVVVWNREFSGPYGREFDAAGLPKGGDFQVSHLWDDYQYFVDVAARPGGFLVVWPHTYEGNNNNILGRAFAGPGPCPPEPLAGCRDQTLPKGGLTLKDKGIDKGDSLSWKWLRGAATPLAAFGDPLGATTYTLCLYDGSSMVALEALVPPAGTCGSKPCWKAKGTTGFKYKNSAATADGIQKLDLKAGIDGKAKVTVKGKGEGLDMPALDQLALPLLLQLQASNGECWQSTYTAAGVSKHTAEVFSGKPSATGG